MPNTVPSWLATMRQITGTHAQHDNPVILGWAKKIGEIFPEMAQYCADYTHDTIAWCGLTVAYCMAANGIKPIFGSSDTDRFLWALAWRQFGSSVTTPQIGDLLVFDFGGDDHHVTLYEQSQGDSYVCRGGNQSHQVRLSTYPKSQCMEIRRPPAATVTVQSDAVTLAVQLFSGITATVFGGAADRNTSAYDGHLIDDTEFGVALPFHFSDPRPTVRVWNAGKSAVCNIVDVGPWNTEDPYWQTGSRPEAESGIDSRGRPTNRAGIDLTPAAARAIDIDGKGTVDWEFSDAAETGIPVATAPSDRILTQFKQTPARTEATMATNANSASQPTPSNIVALIQQALPLIASIQSTTSQGGATTPNQQDQINQVIKLLTALLGQNTLGPVNGALGETIGNLLNGKKTAIGVLGALATQLLSHVPESGALSALTPLAGVLGGASGLTGAGLPIFLALTFWGMLGKFEKWNSN
jgi:uncharacterized protein (TIGR02594 family)